MLTSKKVIADIYENGSTIKSYPFVAHLSVSTFSDNNSFKIVISAPKRTFKTAVRRNRIKRICKEAVRFNKGLIEDYLNANNIQLAIFVVYTAKEELKQPTLQKKTKELFNSIISHIDEKNK